MINGSLLKEKWVKKKNKKEVKNILKLHKNEYIKYQNFRDSIKAILKSIALSAYILKKMERIIENWSKL